MNTVEHGWKETTSSSSSSRMTAIKISNVNRQEVKGPLAIQIERLLRQLKKHSAHANQHHIDAVDLRRVGDGDRVPVTTNSGKESDDVIRSNQEERPWPSNEATELTR